MKWQVGTVEDLLDLGINRLTLRDWGQQAMGRLGVFLKLLWIAVMVLSLTLGVFRFVLFWSLVPILFVAAKNVRNEHRPTRFGSRSRRKRAGLDRPGRYVCAADRAWRDAHRYGPAGTGAPGQQGASLNTGRLSIESGSPARFQCGLECGG